jgi:hypothetical protein
LWLIVLAVLAFWLVRSGRLRRMMG